MSLKSLTSSSLSRPVPFKGDRTLALPLVVDLGSGVERDPEAVAAVPSRSHAGMSSQTSSSSAPRLARVERDFLAGGVGATGSATGRDRLLLLGGGDGASKEREGRDAIKRVSPMSPASRTGASDSPLGAVLLLLDLDLSSGWAFLAFGFGAALAFAFALGRAFGFGGGEGGRGGGCWTQRRLSVV